MPSTTIADASLPGRADAEPFAHTVVDASRLYGLPRTTIYVALANGDLTGLKAGRRTLILADDLKHFVRSLPQADIRVPSVADRLLKPSVAP
jgi:excisionase family DNA binding protein